MEMNEQIEPVATDLSTTVTDDAEGAGDIKAQRVSFDAHLVERYKNEAPSEYPRPMILGARWPIHSADVGIDNAEVWEPDDGVIVIVPFYTGMAKGDKLHVVWGSDFVFKTVTDADVSNQYVSLVVPSNKVKEGKVDVRYFVQAKKTMGGSEALSVLVRYGQPGHDGNGEPTELQAPSITKPANNKVGKDEAESGVEVTVPAYKRMAEFDTISLFWGDEIVSHVVSAGEVGKSIVIKIDKGVILAAGDAAQLPVYYFVSDEVGNESEWSADAFAQVQVTTLTFAPPAIIDSAATGSASVSTLNLDEWSGDELSFTVPAGQLKVNDKVSLKWKSTTEKGLVETLELGVVDIASEGEAARFSLPKSKVWNLAGGSGRAYYEVLRNGVVSNSQSAHISFIGTLVDTLSALTIEEAENIERGWWLSADEPYINAMIPQSANLKAGDRIEITMRGTAADGSTLLTVPRRINITETQQGKMLRLRLSGSKYLKPLDGGFADIYYTLVRGSGKVESTRQRFYIGDTQETLPAPNLEVDISASNNILNPTLPEYSTGTYVELPDLSQVTAPYSITLVWETSVGGYHEQTQNIKKGEAPTDFQVPETELKLNGKPVEVTVYYIVSQDNKPDQASADLKFTIATPDLLIAKLEVNQGRMYLQGGATELWQMVNNVWTYRVPTGSVRTLRSQQRLPSGGKAPFRYQSSNPSVATVDGLGRVWPRRTGWTSITITDSEKQTVSYPVSVSSCFRVMVGQGDYSLLDAERLAVNLSGYYVSLDLIEDLHSIYGRPLPLGRHTWTGQRYHSHGAGSGYFYHIQQKALYFANTYDPTVKGAMGLQLI
jgi:hypothetical protein